MWPYLPTFSNGSFRSFDSLCQWTSCFIMWISSMLIDQAAEFPEKTKTFFCVSIIDRCRTFNAGTFRALIFDICITTAWSTLPRMILLFSEMHHLAGVSISIIPSILHLFSYFSLGSNAYLLFVLCISIFGIASKPDSSSSSPVLSLAFQRKKKSGLDLFLLP